MNNNITAIKAMVSWMNQNGKTSAPANYIDLYIDKMCESNIVESDSAYDDADLVLDYSNQDMEEEISLMDNLNDYSFTEDVEHLEDWGVKSSLEK